MIYILLIILPIIIYLIIGIFDIRKNIFVKSINRVNVGTICLTFDDGPDKTYTPQILDILKKNEVYATFFLVGEKIEKQTDIVKRIVKEGHEIGCHTYKHQKRFPVLPIKKKIAELKKTNKIIEKYTQNKVLYIRPPFGITNPSIKKAIHEANLQSIGWDIRSLDTVIKKPEQLYTRVIKGIERGGSIILFHDRCKNTHLILENLIIYCKSKGLKFKTISDGINQI